CWGRWRSRTPGRTCRRAPPSWRWSTRGVARRGPGRRRGRPDGASAGRAKGCARGARSRTARPGGPGAAPARVRRPSTASPGGGGWGVPGLASTFHGGDVFAPAAAHLLMGAELEQMGAPVREWVRLERPSPRRRTDGALEAHVVAVDRFGNLILDARPSDLPP